MFKTIPDYEDYLINEDGSIVYSCKSKKQLKIVIHDREFKHRHYKQARVTLCKNGKPQKFFISRLVYSVFNGQIPENMEVDHIDNNPLNNHYTNLQLLTRSDNVKKIFKDCPDYVYNRNSMMRKIKCVETNVVYQSITECCKINSLTRRNLAAHLARFNKV